jgi:SagB-type dehydrogenase family enzyme
MDWANEPVPFRRYEGVTPVRLPLLERDPECDYRFLYERPEKPGVPFYLKHIASFLELSMGLSAWKEFQGSSWALRINPSSGNLHPTEAYLILPPLPEIGGRGGVFHYNPYIHGLEPRIRFDGSLWDRVRQHFGIDAFLVGLSSIPWRESWKYGERAFRYCSHDVGHAVACLSFSAHLHGWETRWLNPLSDGQIEALLGFDRTAWPAFENEYTELMIIVHKNNDPPRNLDIPASFISSVSALACHGNPNLLSRNHVDWGIINNVAEAAKKSATEPVSCSFSARPYHSARTPMSAAGIIRQRRSAQAFDGKTGIGRDDFFAILDRTIPRDKCGPFDSCLGETSVHLLIFAHCVRGLDQGLYFLCRNESDFQEIKRHCLADLLWQSVDSASHALPLYLLEKGDFRETAITASCFQEIAGDSTFAVAMISKFRKNIEQEPYLYRSLHWETGMIGQVLYLEAEAHGLRGTGIGCFLDDVTHDVLGIRDDSYQCLYHFTVGGPVEDKRLTTLPPYHHLSNRTM